MLYLPFDLLQINIWETFTGMLANRTHHLAITEIILYSILGRLRIGSLFIKPSNSFLTTLEAAWLDDRMIINIIYRYNNVMLSDITHHLSITEIIYAIKVRCTTYGQYILHHMVKQLRIAFLFTKQSNCFLTTLKAAWLDDKIFINIIYRYDISQNC